MFQIRTENGLFHSIQLSKNLTKEQIEKVFARFDADGDGRLSYSEFKKMIVFD